VVTAPRPAGETTLEIMGREHPAHVRRGMEAENGAVTLNPVKRKSKAKKGGRGSPNKVAIDSAEWSRR
jgi:hypothetical protein